MSDTKNELAKVKDPSLPAHLQDLGDDVATLGNSRAAEDNTLPFLGILQKGSPQVNKQEPEFIKGAEVGNIINTATKDLFSGETGLPFIPCGIQKNLVEWVPRTAGGGYVDTHPYDLAAAREMGATKDGDGRIVLPNGNQLVETLYTFGILPDTMQQAVIGATSTALKPMRDWMALRNAQRIGGKPVPSFARSYLLRTVYNKNDKGDWYTWNVGIQDWVHDEDLFKFALEFAQQIAAGGVRMGRPDQDFTSSAGGAAQDESIPV